MVDQGEGAVGEARVVHSLPLLQVLSGVPGLSTCLLVKNRNLKADTILAGSNHGLPEASAVVM